MSTKTDIMHNLTGFDQFSQWIITVRSILSRNYGETSSAGWNYENELRELEVKCWDYLGHFYNSLDSGVVSCMEIPLEKISIGMNEFSAILHAVFQEIKQPMETLLQLQDLVDALGSLERAQSLETECLPCLMNHSNDATGGVRMIESNSQNMNIPPCEQDAAPSSQSENPKIGSISSNPAKVVNGSEEQGNKGIKITCLRTKLRSTWHRFYGGAWLVISQSVTKCALKRPSDDDIDSETSNDMNLLDSVLSTSRFLISMLEKHSNKEDLTQCLVQDASDVDRCACARTRIHEIFDYLAEWKLETRDLGCSNPEIVNFHGILRNLTELFHDIVDYRENYTNPHRFGTARWECVQSEQMSKTAHSCRCHQCPVHYELADLQICKSPLKAGRKRSQIILYSNPPRRCLAVNTRLALDHSCTDSSVENSEDEAIEDYLPDDIDQIITPFVLHLPLHQMATDVETESGYIGVCQMNIPFSATYELESELENMQTPAENHFINSTCLELHSQSDQKSPIFVLRFHDSIDAKIADDFLPELSTGVESPTETHLSQIDTTNEYVPNSPEPTNEMNVLPIDFENLDHVMDDDGKESRTTSSVIANTAVSEKLLEFEQKIGQIERLEELINSMSEQLNEIENEHVREYAHAMRRVMAIIDVVSDMNMEVEDLIQFSNEFEKIGGLHGFLSDLNSEDLDTEKTDENKSVSFRRRIESVKCHNSMITKRCNDLLQHLRDLEKQNEIITSQLDEIEQALSDITGRMENPSDVLHVVRLDEEHRTCEQIHHYNALKNILLEPISGKLAVIETLIEKQTLPLLVERTQSVRSEFSDVLDHINTTLCRLGQLDDYLVRIQSLAKKEFEWTIEQQERVHHLESLLNGTNIDSSIADFQAAVKELGDHKNDQRDIISELSEICFQGRPHPILSRYQLGNSLKNAQYYEELEHEFKNTWKYLTMTILPRYCSNLLKSINVCLTNACSEAQSKGLNNRRVCWETMFEPGYWDCRLATVKQCIQELDNWCSWISVELNPLLLTLTNAQLSKHTDVSDLSACSVKLWHTKCTLSLLFDEITATYSPITAEIPEQIQQEIKFYDLMRAQVQNLSESSDLVTLEDQDEDGLNDDSTEEEYNDKLDKMSKIQLSILRLRRCEHLMETIQSEINRFSLHFPDLLKPLSGLIEITESVADLHAPASSNAALDTDELYSHMIRDPSNMVDILKQNYCNLLDTLATYKRDNSTMIEEMKFDLLSSTKEDALDLDSTPDSRLVTTDEWETDSGIPNDQCASSMCFDSSLEPVYSDELSGIREFDGFVHSTIYDGHMETINSSLGTAESVSVQDSIFKEKSAPKLIDSDDYTELCMAESRMNKMKEHYRRILIDLLSSDPKANELYNKLAENLQIALKSMKDLEEQFSTFNIAHAYDQDALHQLSIQDKATSGVEGIDVLAEQSSFAQKHRWNLLMIESTSMAEELRDSESLVLNAYELTVCVAKQSTVLNPWVDEQLSKLGTLLETRHEDSSTLVNSIVLAETVKMNLHSNITILAQMLNQTHLLVDILWAIDNRQKLLSLKPLSVLDMITNKATEFTVRTTELVSNLNKAAHRTEEAMMRLMSKIFEFMTTTHSLLIEQGDLDRSIHHLRQTLPEPSQAPTLAANQSDELDGDIALEIGHLKQLELHGMEFEEKSRILQQLRNTISCTNGEISDPVRAVVQDLCADHEYSKRKHRIAEEEKKAHLAYINKLDDILNNQATWLSYQSTELLKQTHPNGVNARRTACAFEKYKEMRDKIDSDAEMRFTNLVQSLESNESKPDNPTEAIQQISQKLARRAGSITKTGSSEMPPKYPLGVRKFLLEQSLYRRLNAKAESNWSNYLNFIKEYEYNLNEINVLMNGIEKSLSGLFRPSKIVATCTQQVVENKDAIAQLKSKNDVLIHLMKTLTHLRSFSCPKEQSALSTTIRGLCQRHDRLLVKAAERGIILQQALKEDMAFESAYNRLVNKLEENLSQENSEGSHSKCSISTTSTSERSTDSQHDRTTYCSVIRAGCYLRDRCTSDDPERATLDKMLDKLRHLWSTWTHRKTLINISQGDRLCSDGNHLMAYENLEDWLHQSEARLNISHPSSHLLQSATFPQEFDIQQLVSVNYADTTSSICGIEYRKELDEWGLSKTDCQNLMSAYGDEALLTALIEDVKVFSEDLDVQSKFWLNDDNDGGENTGKNLPEKLNSRLLRLHLASEIQSQVLYYAMKSATYMKDAETKIYRWTHEAQKTLNSLRNSSVNLIKYRSMEHRSLDDENSEIDTVNVYEEIRTVQATMHSTYWLPYCYIMRHLFHDHCDPSVIYAKPHKKAYSALRKRYLVLTNQWQRVDEQLKLLGSWLKQKGQIPACMGQLDRLERMLQKWIIAFRRAEMLEQRDLLKKLSKAIQGRGQIQKRVELAKSIADPTIKFSLSSDHTLGYCIAQCAIVLNDAQAFTQKLLRKTDCVESAIRAYRANFNLTKFSNEEAWDLTRQNSLIAAQTKPDGDTMLTEHYGKDGVERSRSQRCCNVEALYNKLERMSILRVDELKQLHEALEMRMCLVLFDFDIWRQNYLTWQTKRRFRPMELFRTARTPPHRETSSNISLTSPKSSQSDTSPEKTQKKLSIVDGSSGVENSNEIELTCAEFVDVLSRTGADFQGSYPIELRAAFHAIDKKKLGRITYNQFMDALHLKRQNADVPVAKLIAHALRVETEKCTCTPKFEPKLVGENKYRFGTDSRVYLLRFLNSITMVRVGGGWMSLQEFLLMKDPCRVRDRSTGPDHHSTPIRKPVLASKSSIQISKSTSFSNLGALKMTKPHLRQSQQNF